MFRSLSTAFATSLLALAALPATAQQADICGGLGANAQWLGGDEASSDISTAPNYIEQMALVLMRNEYVGVFMVSEQGEYRIEAQGRNGGDTVIDLRDAGGDIIVSDDDGGGGSASRTEVSLTPGTYCVSMRSFDGAPLTGFVRASRLDQEALTPGIAAPAPNNQPFEDTGTGECNLAAAEPLSLGTPVTNSWASRNVYSITLDSPTALTLKAENEDADPILTLYDPTGNWLAENDDYDGLNSRIDMADPLPAGNYCIALDLYGDEQLPITVSVSEYDPEEVLRNLYARGDASPPLDGTYPVASLGVLETQLRKDVNVGGDALWFSVDFEEDGMVLVEALAQGQGDPVLFMYDDLGRQVGYNDDNAGSFDAQLAVRVEPGTYLVAVRQLHDDSQGIIRMIFERYIRAQ